MCILSTKLLLMHAYVSPAEGLGLCEKTSIEGVCLSSTDRASGLNNRTPDPAVSREVSPTVLSKTVMADRVVDSLPTSGLQRNILDSISIAENIDTFPGVPEC